MSDKSILVVTVPVLKPNTKEEVLEAIRYREKLENTKYDAAPTLTVIKVELEAEISKVIV